MGLENLPPEIVARLGAARARLDDGDLPGALALYDEILAEAGDNADVLAAISGDLGSTGHVESLIQLIAPRYEPERDGPASGINLVQAYLAAGDPEGARHVLDTLFALGIPEIEERLYGFANAISELIATGVASGLPAGARPDAAPGRPKGTAVSISKPIWSYGLEPLLAEILPAKGGGSRRIAFTQFALPGAYGDVGAAMEKPEDEPARLARALPLWLAETFYFSPHYAPITAVGILAAADGSKRPVILDADWTIENMRQLVATTSDGLDYIFTGTLQGRDGVYELTLRLWEVRKFRERKQFTVRWTPATADGELARFRDQLCLFMEWKPCADGAGVEYGRTNAPRAWIEGLGISLGLFLAGKKLWPVELLGPVPPALAAIAPRAAGDPIAALAWLTLRARARELGIETGESAGEIELAEHPAVAKARGLLGV